MTFDKEQYRLSFEFFPPKTEAGVKSLLGVSRELNALQPEFFSVTYGAGGSTRDNTFNVVKTLRQQNFSVAPHLSFGVDTEEAMETCLGRYKKLGVDRIVALRGDMPSGFGVSRQMVYARSLVEFIRQRTGDHFHLEVAAYPEIHPEATSYLHDIRCLKEKLDAGANSAITQYFYNVDAYFYFLDECRKEGIEAPIYPGIMPITHYGNLARFSDSCGAEIPRWIRKKLESWGDNQEAVFAFGEELVTDLCHKLLQGGAPGLHFYTMNKLSPTTSIVRNLFG